jgi:hypothetical protein
VTEAEWLACTDPTPMLGALRDKAGERKLRLFAVAVWRQIRPENERQRLVRAVDTAERYADGLAGRQELLNVKSLAWDVAISVRRAVYDANPHLRGRQPRVELFAAFVCEEQAAALTWRVSEAASWEELRPTAPALIREVFGDPFRPVTIDPGWLTPDVKGLARVIYDDQAFHRLSVLGDALEDAGCSDATILSHCRGAGPHVRGCWVVDAIQGRE